MNRIEFSILLEVTDGNPNGNPDAGNMPRQDVSTGQGLITDVCIKRCVRNYVQMTRAGIPGYDIQISEGSILNELQERAYAELGITGQTSPEATEAGRNWMCQNFFDTRTFGAVMTTGNKQETNGEEESEGAEAEVKDKVKGNGNGKGKKAKGTVANCGQVRGPVQLTFGRSIDPIQCDEHTITRCAVANEKDRDINGQSKTMGRKWTVPYALYRINGCVNPFFATKTGFTEADLALLLEALVNGVELGRSASRGLVSVRRLYVWEHSSQLGNAPAWKVYESLGIERRAGVEAARSFADYEVVVGAAPEGVTVRELVDGEEESSLPIAA
jgi:CRISPR-associated protein Csd2